jgi:hypothetical protein
MLLFTAGASDVREAEHFVREPWPEGPFCGEIAGGVLLQLGQDVGSIEIKAHPNEAPQLAGLTHRRLITQMSEEQTHHALSRPQMIASDADRGDGDAVRADTGYRDGGPAAPVHSQAVQR